MRENKVLTMAVIGVAILLFIPGIISGQSIPMTAANLIASFEGFNPTPYWDIIRYSWGYGTPAPGATGTISESQALAALNDHVERDYNYLSSLLTRSLTRNQWAALLSFSYNLGTGNADNLIANINNYDDAALERQWKLYVNAGGRPLQVLVDRRAKEWEVWNS